MKNTLGSVYDSFSFQKQTFKCTSYTEKEFLFHWTMESGGQVPPHAHKHSDEHFLVTKGTVHFKVGGKSIIKSAGEELLVPIGLMHSIKNSSREEIAVTVKYTPCADVHRMFIIMATLDKANPGSSVNILKYFYVMRKLGLKEFSSPPAFAVVMISLIVSIAGTLSGWNKLVEQFKQ
jgi:quercetin dioxygenase-like cupin family protein